MECKSLSYDSYDMRAHSVAQWCLTLHNPMYCRPSISSVHGILQARVLEWVPISSSRGSSRPRDLTRFSCGSCIASKQILYHWATWEAQLRCGPPSLPQVSIKHVIHFIITQDTDALSLLSVELLILFSHLLITNLFLNDCSFFQ